MSKWQPKKRERVKAKTNGRCAYCGVLLGEKFHVDHIRSIANHRELGDGLWDREHNMNASCKDCNLYKSDLSIEGFREKIEKAHQRLIKIAGYRAMLRYGSAPPKGPIRFYFETLSDG
mgnify:CR=1 FL=1